jgi:hypothetical protein
MRYSNEFLTEILGEAEFVSISHKMSVLYMSDGRNWIGI